MTARSRRGAAVAVAFLAAIIAAFLLLRRGPGGAPGAGEAAGAEQPAQPPGPAVASAALASPSGDGGAPGLRAGGSGAVAPADERPWSEVRLATREAELGPALARDVYDGLKRARQAMSPCFDAAAREEARRPPARPTDGDQLGPPILTLQLEARDGELVVVGAPLQQLGGGTPALAACCEELLRGYRIPARNAVAGGRYRLQYELLF